MSSILITRRAPGRLKPFPVIEIFGPTIQGEGAEAGLATHFVRLGGCDYRCTWCDTMYAVEPASVRDNARRLTSEQIVEEVCELGGAPRWVTLTGGNPALHQLGDLVNRLQERNFQVAVETQGSVWRDWLATVDRLTISPKPPSSSMATPRHMRQTETFLRAATAMAGKAAILKIVCFDIEDLAWATETASKWPQLPLYLSAGTPVPTVGPIRDEVGERYRWLCERVAADARLAHARVLPQLHVIAWKDATGV